MKTVLKKISLIFLAVFTLILLVGCSGCLVPDSVEKAVKRMEKQGYTVAVEEPAPDYVKYGAYATLYIQAKDNAENTLVAVRFNRKGDAQHFYSVYEHLGRDYEVYRQEGEWVFWGTEEAEYDFTY